MSPQISLDPVLVELSQISVRIDERDILKHVDFVLHEREIVTLIGPNGAGKSTLIKVLLGIVHPNAGDIKTTKPLKFSYVPQKFNPSHSLPLRVKDLLALEKCDPVIKQEIIHDTGISKLENSKVQQLSGGERPLPGEILRLTAAPAARCSRGFFLPFPGNLRQKRVKFSTVQNFP